MSKNYNLLSLAFALLLAVSCKKGDSPTPPGEEEKPRTAALDVSSAIPGKIISVRFNFPLGVETGELTIGGQKVVFARQTDSSAIFVVPYLPSGDVKIDFGALDVKTPPSFKIANYTPVTSPDAVKNELVAMLDALKDDTSATETFAGSVATLRENFVTGYARLTSTEKSQLAFMVSQAMQQSLPTANLRRLPGNASAFMPDAFKAPTSISTDEEYRETMIQCIGLYTLAGTNLLMGAKLAAAPASVTQLAGYGLLGTALYLALEGNKCRFLLQKVRKDTRKVESATKGDYWPGLREAGRRAADGADGKEERMDFEKDIAYVMNVTALHLSLSYESKSPVIQSFLKQLKNVTDKINGTITSINAIKNWIVKSPDIPQIDIGIPATGAESSMAIKAEDVNIENVSHPGITITRAVKDGKLILKAGSTTLSTDTEFTLDFVFNQPALGITNKLTVAAVYSPKLVPHSIAMVSGNNQQGEPDKKLANPLKVKILDIRGQPLQDVTVEWRVKSGGGSLAGATSATGADGIAQMDWTLGTPENQEVEAVAKKKDGTPVSGSPIVFKAKSGNPWIKMIMGTTWKRETAYMYATSHYSAEQAAQMHKASSAECKGALTTKMYNGQSYWFIEVPTWDDVTFNTDFSTTGIQYACHVNMPPSPTNWGTWNATMDGYLSITSPRVNMLYTKLSAVDQREILLYSNGSAPGQVNYVRWTKK